MAINQKRDRRTDELICVKVKPYLSRVLYALRRNNSNSKNLLSSVILGFMALLVSDMLQLQDSQVKVTQVGIV